MHQSMDDLFYKIYTASYEILAKGVKEGTVVLSVDNESLGCACCRGEPDAVILNGFNECDAFYFEEGEYITLWGDEQSMGYMMDERERHTQASRKQVEEALARKLALGVQSML